MNEEQLLKLVAFCVLMQDDGGILGKSPNYIKEKFSGVMEESDTIEEFLNKLDIENKNIFFAWKSLYHKED